MNQGHWVVEGRVAAAREPTVEAKWNTDRILEFTRAEVVHPDAVDGPRVKGVYMRLRALTPLLAAIMWAWSPGPAAAQGGGPTGNVVGFVLDSRSGRAVSDVVVTVVARQSATPLATAVTGSRGTFTMENLPSGVYELRSEHVAYADRQERIEIIAERTIEVRVALATRAVQLEPIEVTVRSRWLDINGFYDRRIDGMKAAVIDRRMIDHRGPAFITDLIDDVAGVNVLYLGPGQRTIRFNRVVSEPPSINKPRRLAMSQALPAPADQRGCEPDLYLDGRLYRDGPSGNNKVDDYNILSVAAIEAVEVYVGNTPTQFRHNCGVILIWSRRG